MNYVGNKDSFKQRSYRRRKTLRDLRNEQKEFGLNGWCETHKEAYNDRIFTSCHKCRSGKGTER